MRRVATALNESQYKDFESKLEQLNMSEYGLLKALVESFLETGSIDKVKLRMAAHQVLDLVIDDVKETKKNLL